VQSVKELEDKTRENNYRIVLFDKELDNLHLNTLSTTLRDNAKNKGIQTALVLITNTNTEDNPEDTKFVDEHIKNVMNKDLLRLILEKFI
jgi:hypothetical protein